MMRSPWFSIVGAGLCIGLVPACSPVFTQPPPGDPPPSQTAKREQPADSAVPSVPQPGEPERSPIQPVLNKQTLAEPAHFPAPRSSSDLIPEPRNPAEMRPAEVATPVAQTAPTAHHLNETGKPAEDPPLIQAIRCYLEKRPHEAVAWLDRFERPNQDFLLCFLPLAVRLTEEERKPQDPHEASALLDQLDHLAYPLRRRAPLKITKMCLCQSIHGYGNYLPRPEGDSLRPGELARLYIELQNLSDEWQGKAYSVHLLTTIKMRPFNGHMGWEFKFPDPGPDTSQSERHDFYHKCTFPIPDRPPGFYTLYVKITDVATGREAKQTLDFRIGPRRTGG